MSTRRRNNPNAGAARERAGKIPASRLVAIRTLLVVALACSVYLAFLSFTGGKAVGCGPDSGCDKVLTSRWAYWFGIPVSVFALIVDAVFFGATYRLGRTATAPDQRRAWAVIVPCAVLVAGAAVWFIVLQLAVLRSICPYCMAAHACGLGAALVALWSTPIRPPPAKPWELESTVFVTPASFRKIAIVAGLGLASLVLGQLVHRPQTFVVQSIPDLAPATIAPLRVATNSIAALTSTASPPAGPVAAPPATAAPSAAPPVLSPPVRRPFPVYGGRYEIDVTDVPTLGAPTNAQVIVSLHDYTCSTCRSMHPVIVEAQRLFSNQLVVVTLPMPFDPNCNPLLQRPMPKHTNACDYARLSLAVWRADRTRHHAYDDYLFNGEHAPPLEEARQAAIQLVGANALELALADPRVEQQLRLGIGLYETAYRAGQGKMPQFIIGTNVAVGILPMADLLKLLAGLGLKAQSALNP